MFNAILRTHVYPKNWNTSELVPLFKSGDATSPSDYRGISIGNPLAKLFAKCLNNRIQEFIKANQILPDNALGFRENIRTEDGMFLLNTAVKKYLKPRKKVYAVFIDFSKFYDNFSHELLFWKLFDVGIRGNILRIIMSMYDNISYQIRVSKNNEWCLLKDQIRSNTGLKQGCPLSPTLANLFLYDIHRNLVIGDICLGDHNFNSISWINNNIIKKLLKMVYSNFNEKSPPNIIPRI